MIKWYCDICGKEMISEDHKRFEGKSGRLMYEVITAIDGTWNGGQVCHDCIIEAIGHRKEEKTKWPVGIMTISPGTNQDQK